MEKAELRPALPWRRIVSGTYSAETPTGETYMVERTDAGWLVSLRGEKGRREVLGAPTHIKWLAQCRAETHYGGCAQRKPAAEAIKAAAESLKRAPPRSTPTTSAKPEAAKPTMGRRRRPAKPAPKTTSVVDEGLALTWKASRENGREYHVAVHEGGRFKILEVKGTEGYALFSESERGAVEIECGSLGECKQRAEGLQAGYTKERPKGAARARAAAKSETPKPPAASAEAASEKKPEGEPGKTSAKAAKNPASAKNESCGCKPEPTKPKADAKDSKKDSKKDKRIVEGLLSALRKIDPAVLKNAGGGTP